MRLRIRFEDRAYEVEVDFLDLASDPDGDARRHPVEKHLPEAVLRPRPPQRLPEDSLCRCPIAGRVAAIIGAPGRRVRRHEPVLLVEAMKMEVPIGPAVDGTLKAIHVEPGDAVKTGQVLFELA